MVTWEATGTTAFNMYQDFDPGTFKIKSTPYQDRTQIYKVLLTKKYNGNRGEFTVMYKYANVLRS